MLKIIQFKISDDDRKLVMSDINELFDSGIWDFNVPHFQTNPDLFERKEKHWKNLKYSFYSIVQRFYNAKNFSTRAWCYKSIPRCPPESNALWHNHKLEKSICSAIYYIQLPENSGTTDFMLENKINHFPRYTDSWFLFPSELRHKPSHWDYKNMTQSRVVLACDAFYE